MEPSSLHQRTVDGWVARVAGVGPDQWDAPTPCDAWDVRALVGHVVGEELWTVPLMRGSTIEEVGDRFDGDVLGEDPVGTARAAAAEARRVVEDRLPANGKVRLSYGEERMDEYVRQLCADHLVHAWDLAAATGGDTVLDPELVAAVAEWFAQREDVYRSAGLIAQRAAGDAEDPQTRLLAAFGRSATWSPR
jgi:uncharacterized protein (TIGR03086 family)